MKAKSSNRQRKESKSRSFFFFIVVKVFLPGKFHAKRSLVGYSPWNHKESNITERHVKKKKKKQEKNKKWLVEFVDFYLRLTAQETLSENVTFKLKPKWWEEARLAKKYLGAKNNVNGLWSTIILNIYTVIYSFHICFTYIFFLVLIIMLWTYMVDIFCLFCRWVTQFQRGLRVCQRQD